MMSLNAVPGTIEGGDNGFLSALLQKTGALGGGNRSSSQASAVGGNANVSVNPTIVNSYGGAANANPSNYAPVSGSPYATGSSSAAGTDSSLPSWLSTGSVRSANAPMAGYVDPLTGKVVDAGQDWTMLAIVGAAGLGFLMLED